MMKDWDARFRLRNLNLLDERMVGGLWGLVAVLSIPWALLTMPGGTGIR